GCLILMEAALEGGGIATAVDLGTGSGILAIALTKHGVRDVWAIDTDPLARSIATANVSRNGVAERVQVVASLAAGPMQTDLMVANLFTNALLDLAPHIGDLVHRTGTLICAGFLAGDAARLSAMYQSIGFQVSARYVEQDWGALAFRRPAS